MPKKTQNNSIQKIAWFTIIKDLFTECSFGFLKNSNSIKSFHFNFEERYYLINRKVKVSPLWLDVVISVQNNLNKL